MTEEQDVKLRILLAAKKLFAAQGFDGTTVRQICEEAGANVALVSYHFGGKESLFTALLEAFFPNGELAAIDTGMHPVEGLRMIIREVTLFRISNPELVNIIQQEIIMNNSARLEHIRKHAMPLWQLLRKWLAEGREQGYYRFRSMDTAFMSITGTLLTPRNQPYWMVLMDGEGIDPDTMIQDLTDFILGGLQYTGE
ncbi:TetR family transcriptional regulator [Paenibacillus sp. GCM10027627]|uniref:TetR family transcriptional regulator n=1 Tax=unclassified Paenibacillus TaxID=185978 RepID=UPI00363F5FB6